MASDSNIRRIAFTLLAGAAAALMIWFGTGLDPWWPLLWFAPLPVLLVAARASWRIAGLTALVAWAAGSMNLWHYFHTALQVPVIGCVEIVVAPAVVFALSVLLYRALLLRGAAWSALLALPALRVAFEYIFNLTSPHGTAMSLSYTQLGFLPVLQLASITGPWGITFLLLAFSSALAIILHLRTSARKKAVQILAATCCAAFAVLTYGAMRLAQLPPAGHNTKVGLIASDTPANSGVAGPGPATEARYRSYASVAATLIARGANVVVIPEDLGVLPDSAAVPADSAFQALADKTGATIIAGVNHRTATAEYNEARVYTPAEPVLEYHKQHLLPPFESHFTPGTALTMLHESKDKWGVAICKDMDFTPLSRQYGNAGAALLLVPAWDFNLDWISHGHMAIMRGVESGFAIARAGRGGSLLLTDNRGRILAETRSNSAPFATLLADVPTVHDNTLYLRFGDWFAWLALALFAWTILRMAQLARKPRQ